MAKFGGQRLPNLGVSQIEFTAPPEFPRMVRNADLLLSAVRSVGLEDPAHIALCPLHSARIPELSQPIIQFPQADLELSLITSLNMRRQTRLQGFCRDLRTPWTNWPRLRRLAIFGKIFVLIDLNKIPILPIVS